MVRLTLPPNEKRSENVFTMLRVEERKELELLAKLRGVSRSDIIREAFNRAKAAMLKQARRKAPPELANLTPEDMSIGKRAYTKDTDNAS